MVYWQVFFFFYEHHMIEATENGFQPTTFFWEFDISLLKEIWPKRYTAINQQ